MSFLIQHQQLALKSISAPIQLVHYNPDCYSPDLFSEEFNIQAPERLKQWVIKRQAQFLAGRIAAKNALSCFSITAEKISISEHREPIWPKGIIGSISHSNHESIAVVQHQTRVDIGVGLDIQAIFEKSEYTKLLPVILSRSDLAVYNKMERCFPKQYLATLIFSAKESFFKAVFSQVSQYFDFKDVSVQSIDLLSNHLTLATKTSSIILPEIMLVIHYDFLELNEHKRKVITYCENKNVKKVMK